jgi:hypothetical protein
MKEELTKLLKDSYDQGVKDALDLDFCKYVWPEITEQEEFKPDWDAIAVMVEEQQRMAKRIEELEAMLESQEPVAWGVFEGNLHDMFFSQEEAQEMAELKGTHAEVRPLYATPQRTWAGLTYEEESELIRLAHNHAGIRFYIQAAEAKLKEKNT